MQATTVWFPSGQGISEIGNVWDFEHASFEIL